ncbi:hypothetical protein BACUNI_01851 [Bacteroides uniformis ATCC 8492]|uniref:Uncharacterized protein n=1 Tax=Bacteroides uniformis (strain ATCC 8492 / DSM 6597 / CCUG 4942 / CIP 103695 / JCM 5828 / KCTC 5204 / NCTC 13054 / VPI 0061) TaxID=411479 RepID=A0ABC9NCB6_BACUC|nr:hypothetical protein BACUNI_01851 [Bacteroides uniformis ATCC 8492]
MAKILNYWYSTIYYTKKKSARKKWGRICKTSINH